jgi:glycosyltransferase involved in cell wall biosynthesis
VTLLSVAYRPSEAGEIAGPSYRRISFVWDHAAIPVLRGVRASSALSRALRAEAAQSAVVHDHGLWLMPNVYAGREARRAGTPLVIAPRGMLSKTALAFSPLKKRLFWMALQRDAFHDAACFHATSTEEYEEIRAFGVSAPVAVIPNGIDIPYAAPQVDGPARPAHTVLSLGRIHPKKGLDQLLRAWKEVEAGHPNWQLRIVGPSEGGHDAELKALASSLGLARATIAPAVYGPDKAAVLRDADLFVLPTRNENFAITVAEALASAIPVISTKGAPWSGLVAEGCGWWIDHGAAPLAASLREAMGLPAERRREMGRRGRAWMLRDFSWDRIAGDMGDLYTWLSGASERPAFVRCR